MNHDGCDARKGVACRLLAFAAGLAVAGSACAVPLTFDFSGYLNGTRVDQLDIPGVTFIASDPTRVYVRKGTLQIEPAIDGVDLVIRFDEQVIHGLLRTWGFGMCQTGSDVVDLVHRGSVVNTFDALEPIIGRCDLHAYELATTFDELRFDVLTGETLRILGATFDVGAVPEPGSLALLGLGAVGLLAARRRSNGATGSQVPIPH